MNTDQITAKFATLSNDQIQQFIENYAERIVDDMDVKCLIQFVYDTIVDDLKDMSSEYLLEEISNVYDDEIVEELINSVTVEEVAQCFPNRLLSAL